MTIYNKSRCEITIDDYTIKASSSITVNSIKDKVKLEKLILRKLVTVVENASAPIEEKKRGKKASRKNSNSTINNEILMPEEIPDDLSEGEIIFNELGDDEIAENQC